MIGRRIEAALFAILLLPLARHAPAVSRRLQPFFAWVTWVCLPGRRRSLRRMARVVLGPAASPRDLDRHGRRVLRNIQAFIADVASIDRRSIDELAGRIRGFDGLDHLLGALHAGRGVIMASAHLGGFESAVAALRRLSQVPVHVAFLRDPIRAFDRQRTRARRRLGMVEHPLDGGVDAWLSLRDALQRGEVVTVLADRVMPGQRGATLRFFDRPALLPGGPVRLAGIAGAPIVPTFVVPAPDGGATLRFGPPIRVEDARRPIDDDHPAQRALVEAMERAILAAPEHWLTVDGPWIDERR